MGMSTLSTNTIRNQDKDDNLNTDIWGMCCKCAWCRKSPYLGNSIIFQALVREKPSQAGSSISRRDMAPYSAKQHRLVENKSHPYLISSACREVMLV